jgi:AraC family transcriptional regulator, positive regulator of tynA and feaB
MLGLAETQFSTLDRRPEEQFLAWQAVVATVFVAASISRPQPVDSRGFASVCQARRVGGLTLAWMVSAPHQLHRTSRHIRRVSADAYFLSLTLRGRVTAFQGGRVTRTGPADLALVDGDLPFVLDVPEELEQLCLMIPKAALSPLLAAPDRCAAVRIGAESGSGAMVAAALRSLATHDTPLSARETAGMAEHLVGLVALAVSEATLSDDRSQKEVLTQRVVDEIERGLVDPDLCPDLVARRVSISVSYLTKLLRHRGTTFGHLLLARRLDHAWSMLDPGSGDGRTVTAIATACGFRDAAHFSRCFRSRFGVSPTQRRAGDGGCGPSA